MTQRKYSYKAATITTLLGVCSLPMAQAQDNDLMPQGTQSGSIIVSQQRTDSTPKPNHGQSMAQVETSFGQPLQKDEAVGEPPITRWRYAEFTVYFENNRVIHAVFHRKQS